jgi:hypothetical protein
MRYFRSRHRTDIPKYLSNVRYWMNSGKHMLALSFSEFDPIETMAPDQSLRPVVCYFPLAARPQSVRLYALHKTCSRRVKCDDASSSPF